MTSHKNDPKLPPPPTSVTLKRLFYWQVSTKCHTIQHPPPPYLRDIIYEWSLILIKADQGKLYFSLVLRSTEQEPSIDDCLLQHLLIEKVQANIRHMHMLIKMCKNFTRTINEMYCLVTLKVSGTECIHRFVHISKIKVSTTY